MLLYIKSIEFSGLISYSSDYKTIYPDENKTRKNPAATQIVFHYPKKPNKTPAATAEPITPATFGPIACINK